MLVTWQAKSPATRWTPLDVSTDPARSACLAKPSSRSWFARELGLLVFALVALGARSVSAEERDNCLAEHVDGQELLRQGHLRAARAVFRGCARDACPAAVRVDCAQFDAEVDGAIPTLVLRARDEAG